MSLKDHDSASLNELHDFEDLLPEGEDCEEASENESDEESN